MPLTATIAPSRSSAAAAATASRRGALAAVGAGSRARGPQAGQAFGWAWKRRSRGSSYSARHSRAHREAGHRGQRPVVGHAAHDREPRPAVRAVDERVAVAAVAPGRSSSARQSSQVAPSARDERVAARRRLRSARSRSRSARSAPRLVAATRSTRASGGARRGSRSTKRDRAARRPRPRPARRARRCSTKPAEPELLGQPEHVGPEADALDDALDPRDRATAGDSARSRVARDAQPRAAPRSARAARAAPWPAPPGCAGCAPTRETTTWSARPSAAIRPPS